MALGPGGAGWFPGMEDPTGETMWAATVVLATHLRGAGAERLAGRSVLELGAGTGALASVAAGLRPGPRVLVATDLQHRVDSIEQSVRHAPAASAAALCWGDREALADLCNKHFGSGGAEVVICSDCLYTNWSDNLGGALAETIAAAIMPVEDGVAIIAYMPRCKQHEDRFFQRARELGLQESALPLPEGLVHAPEAASFPPDEIARVRLLEVRRKVLRPPVPPRKVPPSIMPRPRPLRPR